jgi:hypothetical protein
MTGRRRSLSTAKLWFLVATKLTVKGGAKCPPRIIKIFDDVIRGGMI